MFQLYNKNRDRPGIDAEQVKIASFFIKTSFSFAKNSLNSCLRPGCKSHGHPGVEEVQIRVCAKLFRGCGDVEDTFMPCFCILSGEKSVFCVK